MTDAELECPICFELMQKPITLNCGHSGCKACLVKWATESPVCPECREPASAAAVGRLGTNITLQKVITPLLTATQAEEEEKTKIARRQGYPDVGAQLRKPDWEWEDILGSSVVMVAFVILGLAMMVVVPAPQPAPQPAPAVVRTFVHDLIEKGIQEHKIYDGKYYIDLQEKNIMDLTAFRDCADKLTDLQTLSLYHNQISDIADEDLAALIVEWIASHLAEQRAIPCHHFRYEFCSNDFGGGPKCF